LSLGSKPCAPQLALQFSAIALLIAGSQVHVPPATKGWQAEVKGAPMSIAPGTLVSEQKNGSAGGGGGSGGGPGGGRAGGAGHRPAMAKGAPHQPRWPLAAQRTRSQDRPQRETPSRWFEFGLRSGSAPQVTGQ
jgi:hypothetical protein